MSGGNLSGVYHFYTMAVTAATMVYIIRTDPITLPCSFACAGNDWMQGINIGFYSSFLISETSFALFAKSIYPLFGYPWHTLAESKVVSIFNAFIKIQMLWYFRKKCSPLAVNTMTIHKYFP